MSESKTKSVLRRDFLKAAGLTSGAVGAAAVTPPGDRRQQHQQRQHPGVLKMGLSAHPASTAAALSCAWRAVISSISRATVCARATRSSVTAASTSRRANLT